MHSYDLINREVDTSLCPRGSRRCTAGAIHILFLLSPLRIHTPAQARSSPTVSNRIFQFEYYHVGKQLV
ncbi:hypothetical protein J4Q44_G00256840 [Coregonus suidteri]|uniref:Uncharacterized protein n=1 Tax=Coregonus suidteri TaxID=861788 RepID=A0AAN8QG05_9TELE